MFSVFSQGLVLILTIIVAIGPQNVFVLRHGVMRQRVAFTSFITGICDSLMISVCGLGFGHLVATYPLIQTTMLYIGIAFLYGYGTRCFWRARRLQPVKIDFHKVEEHSRLKIALTAAFFTFLNPHAILDLVIIIGGISAQHPVPDRYYFMAGAILGANLWFWTLGFAGSLMSKMFENPRAWQILDCIIGVTMFAIATKLLLNG